MNTQTLILCKKLFLSLVFALALNACAPKTNIDKIDLLKKQVQANAKILQNLEDKDFKELEKEFFACDSMLQYLRPEVIEELFPKLQLTNAYIEQFKAVKPNMKNEIDSTLLQLDNLKADIKSQFLSDSLVTIYIADETQHVDKLSSQIQYFKDRFRSCQKELDDFKKGNK